MTTGDEIEREQMLEWLRWVMAIKGDVPCRYDHHDYCQSHNLDERPCPVEQIGAFLQRIAAEPLSQTNPIPATLEGVLDELRAISSESNDAGPQNDVDDEGGQA